MVVIPAERESLSVSLEKPLGRDGDDSSLGLTMGLVAVPSENCRVGAV
jgi:hypothetical protein